MRITYLYKTAFIRHFVAYRYILISYMHNTIRNKNNRLYRIYIGMLIWRFEALSSSNNIISSKSSALGYILCGNGQWRLFKKGYLKKKKETKHITETNGWTLLRALGNEQWTSYNKNELKWNEAKIFISMLRSLSVLFLYFSFYLFLYLCGPFFLEQFNFVHSILILICSSIPSFTFVRSLVLFDRSTMLYTCLLLFFCLSWFMVYPLFLPIHSYALYCTTRNDYTTMWRPHTRWLSHCVSTRKKYWRCEFSVRLKQFSPGSRTCLQIYAITTHHINI